MGWGLQGTCLAWLGTVTGSTTGSEEGQAAPRDRQAWSMKRRFCFIHTEGLIEDSEET